MKGGVSMEKSPLISEEKENLVQRSSITLESCNTSKEKIEQYVSQIKNPYCYLEGDTVVTIHFSETGKTIDDCIKDYYKNL